MQVGTLENANGSRIDADISSAWYGSVVSQPLSDLSTLPAQLVLDGGCGTFLIAHGLDVRVESTAAWNLSHRPEVLALHQSFVDAGAGAIQTNTFAANSFALAPHKIDPRECNLAAVALAKQAVDGKDILVIGNIGPTGQTPPPQGDGNLLDLEDSFAEQAALLSEGGVDFIHVETMVHPKEMRAALRGVRMGAPGLAVAVSIACRAAADSFKTTMGFPLDSMLAVAMEEHASGVGANCMLTPEAMAPLIAEIVAKVNIPVFAKPTVAPDGGAPLYPDEFGEGVAELFALGARAVGGCCGTAARDIDCAVRRVARGYA